MPARLKRNLGDAHGRRRLRYSGTSSRPRNAASVRWCDGEKSKRPPSQTIRGRDPTTNNANTLVLPFLFDHSQSVVYIGQFNDPPPAKHPNRAGTPPYGLRGEPAKK